LLKGRLLLEWGVITLFATLVIGAAYLAGFTQRLDNLLYDTVATWRAPPASDQILIVEIDNQSLKAVGKWQWPRDVQARLITRLSAARPKTIAYDVLFIEPSDSIHDAALAAAIAADGHVVLPVLYNAPGLNGASHDIFLPIPALTDAAAGVGTVNLLFDGDGLVRRAQLETRMEEGGLEHLMEQTYRLTKNGASPAFKTLTAPHAQSAEPDTDDSDSVLIPYRTAGAFRHISASSVLAGEVPAAFLKDKIVLVGATADGLGDRYPVPSSVGSTMSGVEIQANLLNGLLSNRFVARAPQWLSLFANVVPAWLLMVVFLRWRPTTNLLASIGFIIAVLAMSALAVGFGGLWIAPGPALIGLLLVYPLWGWRRLEALSSFVFRETQSLQAEPGLGLVSGQAHGGLDSVAEEALQLRAVIGELRGVRRFMSDVVTGFPDAICVVDADMRITLANPAAADVLGGGLKGSVISERLQLAAPGTTLTSDDMGLADGRTFLIRKVPLTGGAGREAGSIFRFADISRLRDADREREEMLEFLSHDMRAPQAAIITLLESQKDRGADGTLWTQIDDNARKTLKLAEDFVQGARLSAADLKMSEVNIAAAFAEAIDVVWPQAARKAIKIEATGMELEAFILGDPGALVRALTNLVDNAVKYSPPDSTVQCRVEMEGATSVRCRVSDHGPGLPLARQSNVFARFGARGNTTMAGSGLGLAFVKKVVDRHHGTIDWTSSSSHGTRFTLSFPVIPFDDLSD
jgi:CHASE2 domain-containing sensor protein